MFENIFKTIQYFITERIPEIKYVSLYNDQFNRPLENRAIPTPAILIEILPINFDNLLNNVQYAKVNVNIHFGTEIVNGFDRNDAMQDSSFKHLNLLDKIYLGLNNINSNDLPDNLKSDLFIQAGLKRTGVQVLQYNSTIHHSIINASFIFFDGSAVKRYTEYELTDINSKIWYQEPFGHKEQAKILNIK